MYDMVKRRVPAVPRAFGAVADASVRRTYNGELSRLSEAASHELRLVLETLGVPGLTRILQRMVR